MSVPIVKTHESTPHNSRFIPSHWERRPSEPAERYLRSLPLLPFPNLFTNSPNIYCVPHCVRGSLGHLTQIRGGMTNPRDSEIRPFWIQTWRGWVCASEGPWKAQGGSRMELMWSPTRLLLWPQEGGHASLSCRYLFGEIRCWSRRSWGLWGIGKSRVSRTQGRYWGTSEVLDVKALCEAYSSRCTVFASPRGGVFLPVVACNPLPRLAQALGSAPMPQPLPWKWLTEFWIIASNCLHPYGKTNLAYSPPGNWGWGSWKRFYIP